MLFFTYSSDRSNEREQLIPIRAPGYHSPISAEPQYVILSQFDKHIDGNRPTAETQSLIYIESINLQFGLP